MPLKKETKPNHYFFSPNNDDWMTQLNVGTYYIITKEKNIREMQNKNKNRMKNDKK